MITKFAAATTGRRLLFATFFLLALSVLYPGLLRAEEGIDPAQVNSYFFSINYPGVGVGWRFQRHSLELKSYHDGTNFGIGPRYDYHWATFNGGTLYLSTEYLQVDFEGDLSEGSGEIYGLGQGLELFLAENYTFGVDVGPYQVDLEDDDTSISADGWEIIMNLNFKFYF